MPRKGLIIAIGALILSAFALSGPPAGADHIAGEDPYFSCRASVARATLTNGSPIPTIEPLTANANRDECAEDSAGAPTIALPPAPAANPAVSAALVQATTDILCADDDPDLTVTPGNNDDCDAGRRSFEQQVVSKSDAGDVRIVLGGPAPANSAIEITAQAANTSARASCTPGTNVPRITSTSNVVNLVVKIGGIEIPIQLPEANQEQTIDLGLVKIVLNEVVVTAPAGQGPNAQGEFPDGASSGEITRRAIHVQVPGGNNDTTGDLADVVVAESTADFHGDVCPEGKVVIKKETAPDESPNSTPFNFTASPGLDSASSSFTLMDDGQRSLRGSSSPVAPAEAEVLPGTFTVTEGAPTNDYVLTAINCAENRTDNSTTALGTRTATINVGPGETVTCTFINAKPPPGVCPTGSTPNGQGQCIITNLTCPAGSTGPNAQGQCIVNTTTCPAGSTRPDPAGPCVVTTPNCPAGSTVNAQGQCIINTTTCPTGSTRPDPAGPCVVTTPTCPAGSTANPQGQCVNNTITCPNGATLVAGQCVVSRPDCPAGTARNPQGQCVISSVQCPAGTAFNPTTLGCTAAPRGGTLVPINQLSGFFRASPCLGQGFGQLVGIVGTNGPDRITGTNLSDRIFALGGNDRVSGGRGDDCVEGGTGNDVIDGSNGNDVMLGGSGNDSVNGGPGRDRFEGGSGRDVMTGGTGNDRMRGGAGRDRLNGSFGNDVIFGGSGNDGISTGNGRDRVFAGSGNDIVNVAIRGAPAFVDCGPGKDRVRINKNERKRTRNCEFIDITRRIRGR